MTLLAGEALKIAEHVLGGAMHPAVSGLRVLNETGEWLVSARPWRYLVGGCEALDLVAGQWYVELPEDFGAMISIAQSEGYTKDIRQSTPEEIMDLRRGLAPGGDGFIWAALTYDHADITGTSSDGLFTVTPSTAAEIRARKSPLARLQIYPEPETSATGALLLFYTRGWRSVSEDTDTIFVPSWLEGVYLRAVRIWARGYEGEGVEQDSFDRDLALEKLVKGPQWRAAVTRDSNVQMEMGMLRGGAVGHGYYYNRREGAVEAPSS